MTRWIALLLLAVSCSGCVAALLTPALALDAVVGSVGIFQKFKARGVEREHVDEIKALREEVKRLREQLQAAPPPK